MYRIKRAAAALVTFAVVILVVAFGAVPSTAETRGEGCDSQCQADLDRARAATEIYWDVAVANEDGFVQSSTCEPSPSGGGTIGIQYANPQHADESLKVDRPQALIYVPEGAGTSRRLVALEYSVPVLGPDQPRPSLFGQEFGGPTPDRSGELPRYRLRVWLFSDNPRGLFADANPSEACDADQLAAADVRSGYCHELFASFNVPEERVREVGNIPDELTLVLDENGNAQVDVATFSCAGTDDGSAAAMKFTLVDTLILPPDWPGDVPETSRYLLRYVGDNSDIVKQARSAMGVGPDVFAHNTELDRHFAPIVGASGEYEYSSPDFEVRATVTEPIGDLPAASIRMLHQGPRGMARYHVMLVGVDTTWDVTPVEIEVTPQPGTLLAKLIGCPPASNGTSCEPVTTDAGSAAAWDRAAATMTVERDWWNPRATAGS